MSGMSRDDLVRQFGEPGVENPDVVDLITPGPGPERVTLVMIERRGWDSLLQLRQIEEKINRYLGYVLDGFLVQQYPEYEGRHAVLRIDCRDEPTGEAAEFLRAAREAIEGEGLELEVRVRGSAPEGA